MSSFVMLSVGMFIEKQCDAVILFLLYEQLK